VSKPQVIEDEEHERVHERVAAIDAAKATGMVCLRVHQLLDGAVAHACAMGATALEGYPVDPGTERIDQTSGYVGTVRLFEAHRFRRVCQTAGQRGGKPRWLVRRELP
jgi:hypothetical protein